MKSSKTYAAWHTCLSGLIKFFCRVHVHDADNEPSDGAYIMVSNHISNADPIFLAVCTKKQQPYFMAKKELFKIPVFRSLIASLGAFPVDRKGNDVGAIKKSVQLLKEGKCLGIFPQGHRYKKVNPRGTEVKNGAAMLAVRSGVQILPCYIKMKNNIWRPFRRIDIYIGEPIPNSDLNYNAEASGEYARISEFIFGKVCDIGEKNA